MPREKRAQKTPTAGRGAAITIANAPDDFARWLDSEFFRRYGRAKSNRSICIEAALPENALYRVLTLGERPSPLFIERMAAHLGIVPEQMERQVGWRPLLEIGTEGQVHGAEALTEDERRNLRRALRAALASVERDGHTPAG